VYPHPIKSPQLPLRIAPNSLKEPKRF